MRRAQRYAVSAVRFCIVGTLFFILFSSENPSIKADGDPGADVLLVGRAWQGKNGGALAEWRGDLRAWRPMLPGDTVERGSALRVGHDGCVELLVGIEGKSGRMLLGPGTRAVVLPIEHNTIPISLTGGALRVTTGERALRIRTPLGELDLTDGEAVVSYEGIGISMSLLRGTGSVQFGTGAKQPLVAGGKIGLFKTNAGDVGWRELDKTAGNLAAFWQESVQPSADAGAQSYGRLVIRDASGRETGPLEVRELRVRAHISGDAEGAVALTEIEETFFNPTDRQAEGTFYFPVPAGASLSRFAMYVNGTLVEGELVGRDRARTVYEQIVRKMQDPALMEWQEGNIFKTRIFPIPAHGPKRILISYTQPLPSIDGERRYVYPLAGKTTQAGAIGSFEFEAVAVQPSSLQAPRVAAYPDAETTLDKDGAHVRLVRRSFQPEHDLVLRCAAKRSAPLALSADRRPNEDGFFMLSYVPPAPAGNNSSAAPSGPNGRDVVVMVDTSLSRRADDYKAQLKVVRTLLREMGPNDRFATLSFDVAGRVHQPGFVSGKDAVAKAMSELEAIVPLGATDLEAAFSTLDTFLAHAEFRSRVDVVCVSDGVATLGETALGKLADAIAHVATKRNARIHTVAMGAQHERKLLREVARQSGGLFRTIIPGDSVEQEAFRLALALESQLLPAPKFDFIGGGVHDVYPAQPGTLVAGEELILTARYATSEKVTVRVTQDGQETSAAFDLPKLDDTHVFIARSWAGERLDALLLLSQSSDIVDQIVGLSQEFTLITPYTSFLVLENEGAYKTYGIDRMKRRRYWDAASSLKSVPPSEEVQPVQPAPVPIPGRPIPRRPIRPIPDMAQAAPHPHIFSLADVDLALLRKRSLDGREVTTALSSLCLETYYRYAQLNPNDVSSPPATASAPPPQADPITRAASVVEVPPDIMARAELGDHFETINLDRPDTNSAFGNPDAHMFHSVVNSGAGGGGMGSASLEDMIGVGGARSPGTGGGWGGGTGIGIGNDSGSGRGSFGSRNGGGRKLMIKRHGGSKATENSVDAGLRWLAYHQFADGSCGDKDVEATSLALLALSGAGHSEKVGEYKPNVKAAVQWLIAQRRDDGQIGSSTYEHALATLALSEAAAMANMPETRELAQKSIERLSVLQEQHGDKRLGWSNLDNKSNPLTTAWAVMALKSAKVAGLNVQHAVFDGAIEYLDQITAPNGAVGEHGKPAGGEADLLNTAAVALCRQFLGWKREDLTGAANLVLPVADGIKVADADLLRLRYFGTLMTFQQGGDAWKKWNEWIKKDLYETQRKDGDDAGSWNPRDALLSERNVRAETKTPAELEKARAEFEQALAGVKAAPSEPAAYQALARNLSIMDSIEILQSTLEEATDLPVARGLVRLRMGLVLAGEQKFADAAECFRRAYVENDRPESVLPYYVHSLNEAGRASAALDVLMAEANEGRLSAWRRTTLAALLLDTTRAAPAASVADHIKGGAAKDTGLRVALAQHAKGQNRRDAEAVFYAQAYDLGERSVPVVVAYAESLRAIGRTADGLKVLMAEAAAGRATRGLPELIAEYLLNDPTETDPVGRIAKDLAAQPAIRPEVYKQAARVAERLNKRDIAAALYERTYIESDRPMDLVQSVVTNMIASGQHAKAAQELERVIQAGFHTPWAFKTLVEADRVLHRSETEILRAVSSETELFPNEAQPHLNLAQFYETVNKPAAALAQYRESIRAKPDDPYFYKQLVERAIGLGRYDFARETLLEMTAHFPNQGNVWGNDDKELLALLNASKPGDSAESKQKIRDYFTKDLVVVLSWDTNGTDVDLHVTDPDGEECFYSHRATAHGGNLDHDVTTGMGPETFALRRAKPGKYRIDVNYYAGTPRTMATVQIYRHRNGQNESAETKTIELRKAKDRVTVQTIDLP